jgi:hypothetical protein
MKEDRATYILDVDAGVEGYVLLFDRYLRGTSFNMQKQM